MSISHDHKPRLLIRPLEQTDFAGVAALSVRVYGSGYSQDMVRGQLGNFPEGQFVAECDDKIVGHCATFRIRQGHQRVQRAAPRVPVQHVESARTRKVRDHGGSDRLDPCGHVGDGPIGRGDQQEVDAVCGVAHRVISTQRFDRTPTTGGRERAQE